MQWIESTLYPLQSKHCKHILLFPGLALLGWLIYSLTVGGGFLYIVGYKTMTLSMALSSTAIGFLVLLFMGAGYAWEVLGCLQEDPQLRVLPSLSDWKRYLIEGIQLALFYGLLIAFLASAAAIAFPIGVFIMFLVLAFHPLLIAPMVFSTRDKTFLGLLDGCLDAIDLAKSQHYLHLWLETTLYVLFIVCIFLPLALFSFGMTMIGVFAIPGILSAVLLGFGHLLTQLIDYEIEDHPAHMTSLQGAPPPETPFSTVHLSVTPLIVFDELSRRPNPWQQPNP